MKRRTIRRADDQSCGALSEILGGLKHSIGIDFNDVAHDAPVCFD